MGIIARMLPNGIILYIHPMVITSVITIGWDLQQEIARCI
jgi:hypothetical protein